MRRRVVVTGIGTVSSAGLDALEFTAALKDGKQCFAEIDDPRIDKLTATHAGRVFGLEPGIDDPQQVRSMDRNVHLALKALREALHEAGLQGKPLGRRAAVVFGTCSGGMLSIERHYEGLNRGEDPLDESLLFSKRYHTTAKVLAWAAGASGPAFTIVTACSAGAGAIAHGADLVRSGRADIALAGGGDTLAMSTLAGFDALKATCKGMCKPFSTTMGLNLGEGAAVLVLESLESAVERGARPLAELLGFGLSNDAYHPTAPDPSTKGQVAAMKRALDDAGANPDEVDYINAHGTGTRANDLTESKAIGRLFAARSGKVPVSSTKSMIGHCLGAAGALEASATVLAARAGFVPPTAGYAGRRDGCNLEDYVPDKGRKWTGRIALSNSFGFGGNNACLLMDVFPTADRPVVELKIPKKTRVSITGLGLVSPLGVGIEKLIDDSRTGIADADRFKAPVKPFSAGMVPPLDAREVDRRLDLKGMDLFSQYAAVAARSALEGAGFKVKPREMSEVGMVMGIAAGPSRGEMEHLNAVMHSGFDIERLGAFPYVVPNEAAGNVSRALMLKGHNTVIAAGCGAGLVALVSAATALEQGHGDAVLASASDELTERTLTDGYKVGFWGPGTEVIPGEGACALLLETESGAASRNTKIIAEIIGYAMATDIDDPMRASGQAPAAALETAMERAEIEPGQIQFITACTSGSPIDSPALNAIKAVFGEQKIKTVDLSKRIGFAEAALPLFELSYAIAKAAPGSHIAACSLSPEGFASAVIVRVSGFSRA